MFPVKKHIRLSVVLAVVALSVNLTVSARDYINIVGSSTVYPFAKIVAERFAESTNFKAPEIESTGSGNGLALFCSGVGSPYPDIANSSRRIKLTELKNCVNNGVDEIIEVLVGYDGIVLADITGSFHYSLNRMEIFSALAKEVPNPDGCDLEGNPEPHKTCLIANPYKTWKQVNPALPDIKIKVFGPPLDSGTRDAFTELALEGGCRHIDWIADMRSRYKAAQKENNQSLHKYLKKQYKTICHTIREDGHYVEAGENDDMIIKKLLSEPNALGVFGYSFLDHNKGRLQGTSIEGTEPTFNTIANKSYPISRPLYFYFKKAHVNTVPGLRQYVAEFTSEAAWGSKGYLTTEGLIPLSKGQRMEHAYRAANLMNITASDFPY